MESAILGLTRFEPGDENDSSLGYWRCKYLETITDEDRLEHYKLMAVRCEVEG